MITVMVNRNQVTKDVFLIFEYDCIRELKEPLSHTFVVSFNHGLQSVCLSGERQIRGSISRFV